MAIRTGLATAAVAIVAGIASINQALRDLEVRTVLQLASLDTTAG